MQCIYIHNFQLTCDALTSLPWSIDCCCSCNVEMMSSSTEKCSKTCSFCSFSFQTIVDFYLVFCTNFWSVVELHTSLKKFKFEGFRLVEIIKLLSFFFSCPTIISWIQNMTSQLFPHFFTLRLKQWGHRKSWLCSERRLTFFNFFQLCHIQHST